MATGHFQRRPTLAAGILTDHRGITPAWGAESPGCPRCEATRTDAGTAGGRRTEAGAVTGGARGIPN
eukprot:9326142-Alexandrium_andersonii.AAC.1